MESRTHDQILTDKLVSIAILSPAAILTIQYFILVTFNLMNSPMQSVIQTISMLVVGLLFLTVLPRVIKNNNILIIASYYIFVFLFVLHYLIFPVNRTYLVDMIFPFFFISLLIFNYTYIIQDWKILKLYMVRVSHIILILGLILSLFIVSNVVNIEVYSMSLSYYMLLPSIVYLNETLNKLSIKYSIFAFLSLSIIVLLGSRGALFCFSIFLLLKMVLFIKKLSHRRILLLIAFAIPLVIIILNAEFLLTYLFQKLYENGIYSRTLDLLITNITYSSGRDSLYQNVIETLMQGVNIFWGLGIAGDRIIFDGDYVHNIVLEVILNFGLIIGAMVIIVYIMLILVSFSRDKLMNEMLMIWFCIGLLPLFMSSSYWIDIEFWIFSGLILNIINKKYRKKV